MKLEFGNKVIEGTPRKLKEMIDVVYDRQWLEQANMDMELYYMFRDLSLSKADRERLMESGLRYDITVIPPNMLGCEYVKTAGHFHPYVPGENVSYTELYEVLGGEAVYLFQKQNNGKVEDVIVVEAHEGDKVLIPPNYGHITINSSNKILKMANLVARDFESDYEPIRERRGGAYYLTAEGFVPNENYEHLPEIRFCKPTNTSLAGLSKSKEIYSLVKSDEGIRTLRYLTHPQEYTEMFERLY
jgi:glucose-6-phosphate isomerase